MCGEEQTKILYNKWRLDEVGWKSGDIVPRPRSVEEFGQKFMEQLGGGTIEHARAFDASMVEAFQPLVESPFGQLYFQFLVVPIDEAQTWWDNKYSETATPDGKLKR
jgi:hypothetical protein